jgi:hypothetical protein
MHKKLMYAMIASLLALTGASSQGAAFADDFDYGRDYLISGADDTGWDGFLGLGAGQTVTALTTMDAAHPGQLYIASGNNGRWREAWNPLPPFLYRVVSGDFIATVKVTDYAGKASGPVYYNNAALMARAGVGSVGTSENWVSIDYFPLYNCGNYVRSALNGVRTENGNNGLAWNLDPWLQLERAGNVFHFRTSPDGNEWTEMPVSPLTRGDLDGVPLEVGLTQCTYSTAQGYAAFDHFTLTGPNVARPAVAINPFPAGGATDVLHRVVLSWTPAARAVRSDVYFGTSQTDVNAAVQTRPLNVLVSAAQEANTYDSPGVLAYGRTYYWRVDGVDAGGTVVAPGRVWSFTVEPMDLPIANVTAEASSSDVGTGPELTIDGSGMIGDLHDTDAKAMWSTAANGSKAAWIQYTFGRIYKMQELWVWNYNSEGASATGLGPRDVTIQYSIDGVYWSALDDVVFNRAPGTADYAHNTTIPLNGIIAKEIRLVVKSTWTPDAPKAGLSEVRFFYIPVWARDPKPATGATNVDLDVTLSWRPGREAAAHYVCIGVEEDAVRDSVSPCATAVAAGLSPAGLELGTTYYWKVSEVNTAASPKIWLGDVWSFTTQAHITVDDMEDYADTPPGRIFDAWVDGWGTTDNASQVGYGQSDNGTFAETVIVHGGKQSMPFLYGRNSAAVSEATRTFAPAQDWTAAGARTLVLWFCGKPSNSAGEMYVKINGIRVDYPGDASTTSIGIWKQWNVDLTGIDADLTAVGTLTIGVAGPGAGILYFDDIRLYKFAPAVVTPVDPGTAGLMARFAMEDGQVQDSSGYGYAGTLYNVTFGDSLAGFGRAARFNGAAGYVDMGTTISSGLLRNLTSCTFSVWVNYPSEANPYGRVFDFGISRSSSYAYLAAQGDTRAPRFGIRTETLTERTAWGPREATAGWHHIAVVIDASTIAPTMTVYLDGESGTTVGSIAPKDMGATTNNWLGRSQYKNDPYLNADIDEFRIFNRALTPGEVRYLAGDR